MPRGTHNQILSIHRTLLSSLLFVSYFMLLFSRYHLREDLFYAGMTEGADQRRVNFGVSIGGDYVYFEDDASISLEGLLKAFLSLIV